ncbi:MAG: CDP-alcohol phosphatidyltransferase family protein [Candidatus Omnitrophica bacterium]|nr:CDP-alcohol phosphatidyltransferase family protein [Candidatus Omnitrophota bacterium]
MTLTLANKITIIRIMSIPFLIAAILYISPHREWLRWAAFGGYLLAEISDVVDGYIARHFRQKTRAGSILDPLADKLLFMGVLIALYKVGMDHAWPVHFPLWLVVVFIGRDVILIAGSLLLEIRTGGVEIRPNILGKMTAFLQFACVAAVFLQIRVFAWMWWGVLAVAAVSGIIYMTEGVKKLNDGHR